MSDSPYIVISRLEQLLPSWRIRHDAMRREYSARRGRIAVYGTAEDLVEAVRTLEKALGEEPRAMEPK